MEVTGSESEGRTEKGREKRGQRPTWCDLCVGVCARTERFGSEWCQHVDAAVIALDGTYLQTFSQDAEVKKNNYKSNVTRNCSCQIQIC